MDQQHHLELDRNADSWASPVSYWIVSKYEDPGICVFTSPSGIVKYAEILEVFWF